MDRSLCETCQYYRVKRSCRRERVFPEDLAESGFTRPYDTISEGVKLLARWLHENNGRSDKPNVNSKQRLIYRSQFTKCRRAIW